MSEDNKRSQVLGAELIKDNMVLEKGVVAETTVATPGKPTIFYGQDKENIFHGSNAGNLIMGGITWGTVEVDYDDVSDTIRFEHKGHDALYGGDGPDVIIADGLPAGIDHRTGLPLPAEGEGVRNIRMLPTVKLPGAEARAAAGIPEPKTLAVLSPGETEVRKVYFEEERFKDAPVTRTEEKATPNGNKLTFEYTENNGQEHIIRKTVTGKISSSIDHNMIAGGKGPDLLIGGDNRNSIAAGGSEFESASEFEKDDPSQDILLGGDQTKLRNGGDFLLPNGCTNPETPDISYGNGGDDSIMNMGDGKVYNVMYGGSGNDDLFNDNSSSTTIMVGDGPNVLFGPNVPVSQQGNDRFYELIYEIGTGNSAIYGANMEDISGKTASELAPGEKNSYVLHLMGPDIAALASKLKLKVQISAYNEQTGSTAGTISWQNPDSEVVKHFNGLTDIQINLPNGLVVIGTTPFGHEGINPKDILNEGGSREFNLK